MDYLIELERELGAKTKYLEWYIKLVVSRANQTKVKGDYIEAHHILPTRIYGKNLHIVNLTFREHYLAHLFLALHAKRVIVSTFIN